MCCLLLAQAVMGMDTDNYATLTPAIPVHRYFDYYSNNNNQTYSNVKQLQSDGRP